MESLQGFFINQKYDGKEITPNLNSLVKDSAYFNNCYVQIGIGHTADAELLVNTSLYPEENACAYLDRPKNTYESIATMLKEQNYSTYAFHGNRADFWNRSEVYKNMGFDNFYSLKDFNQDDLIFGLSDASFLKQSFNIIKNFKTPFYSFLVTLTSHSPFEVPNYSFTQKRTEMENYINAVNYTDKALGTFIDNLKSSGILNNSILIVYGDHQGIDEEQIGKLLNKDVSKDYEKESLKKVPMIIHFPNNDHAGTYSNSIGQNDILASIKSIFNLKDSPAFGTDIFSKNDNLVVLRNGSYVFGDTFYNSRTDTTNEISSGKQLKNDEQKIANVKQQLQASDIILKFDYFKAQKNNVNATSDVK